MEDKYLSKAKRIDNGDWLVGYIVKYGYTGKEKYYIVPSYASDLYAIEIDPSTICRNIGLKDKNDNLIGRMILFINHSIQIMTLMLIQKHILGVFNMKMAVGL